MRFSQRQVESMMCRKDVYSQPFLKIYILISAYTLRDRQTDGRERERVRERDRDTDRETEAETERH